MDDNITRCAKFWMESPSVLITEWYDFYPFTETAQKCSTTALNAFTRFGIYLGVLLSILYLNGAYLGISIGLIIISLVAYYTMKEKGTLREGFKSTVASTASAIVAPTMPVNYTTLAGGNEVVDKSVVDIIGSDLRTYSTSANPFMNVLINEIKDNPTRGPAETMTERDYSNVFQMRMYGDPTDVFQHNQNQRIWAVQPNTSIPNDQESFQNWLFRTPGKTCKEGNSGACRTGTEGSTVTWINAD